MASEPYGVVEETDTYLRLDGDVPVDPANPASQGQVVALRGVAAGAIAGIERWAYDGTRIPVGSDDLAVAQITTRDIDRGDAPHYLLKEIGEAAGSFRKTLRGSSSTVPTAHVSSWVTTSSRRRYAPASPTGRSPGCW